MSTIIIITCCILLLIAYFFDISSSFTKIPSVILLLLLGWLVNFSFDYTSITKPDFSNLLPIIGTLGLILIVLDGSLELEINKHKWKTILKSLFMALVPMILLSIIIILVLDYYTDDNTHLKLINALPFCIISSAIAIPSAHTLSVENKEYVVYESSISDILGVMFFNFLTQNEQIQSKEIIDFSGHFFLILFISFITVIGLAFLLSRLKHHVTYAPIILIVILFYAVSKHFHLPGLLFILIFGLVLGNLDELKDYKWIQKFNPDKLNTEVHKFKSITTEVSFIIRAIFFIIFGYSIQLSDIINQDTILLALIITIAAFVLRALSLMLAKVPLLPILFYAPRGLITILLFLSILPHQRINIVNNSLVIQIVLLSILVLMLGSVFSKKVTTAN